MTAPEFPVLGTEPIAVEFANTRYGADRIDFLRTARLVDQWFAQVAGPHGLVVPARHTTEDAARIRTLRDHTRTLLEAAAVGTVPAPEVVAEVNGFSATGPPALGLHWAADGTRRAHWVDTTIGTDAVLARIATNAVELLTARDAGALARCRGPGCTLLFVRTHPRRRWCDPACGHRDRQARYYRRHRPGATR